MNAGILASFDPMTVLAKATVLLLAVLLARAVLSRASAATGHLMLSAGLSAALLLPVAVALLPGWQVEVPVTPVVDSGLSSGGEKSWTSASPVLGLAPTLSPGSPAGISFDPESLAAPAAPTHASSPSASSVSESEVPWLTILWFAGGIFVAGRAAAGWARMARIHATAVAVERDDMLEIAEQSRDRMGLRRLPQLFVSDRVKIPLTWGFVRPVLLLPVDALNWSHERLRVVLLHELAHVQRRDMTGLLVSRLTTAAYWFHPLAWIAARGARRDAERACDDRVLACGERPSNYAGHLVAIASIAPRTSFAGGTALAFGRQSQLETRVRSILHPRLSRGLGRFGVALTLVAVGLALVAVSSATLVAQEPRSDDSSIAERARALSLELVGDDAAAAEEASAGEPLLIAQSRQIEDKKRAEYAEKKKFKDKKKYEAYADGKHGNHGEHDEAGAETYERAYDLHSDERFEAAAAAFAEAYEMGFRRGTAAYNAACGHARMSDPDEAIRWIHRAMEAGFDRPELMFKDHDFDPIRGDGRFREMLEVVAREYGRSREHDDRYQAMNDLYRVLVERDSTDGKAWYEVGSGLLGLRRLESSVDALERAVDHLDYKNEDALYNLACAYALQGNERRALDALEAAVLGGFENEERFENDSDLAAIRESRRFAEIAELHAFLSLDRFRRHGDWNDGSEYSKARWEPAIAEYRDYLAREKNVGRAWFNLGWSQHFSSRHGEAVTAFEKAVALGYRTPTSHYNVACANAMAGKSDAALRALGRAVDSGFAGSGHMAEDDDLKSLHDDPRFEELLEAAAAANDHAKDRWSSWKRQIKTLGTR